MKVYVSDKGMSTKEREHLKLCIKEVVKAWNRERAKIKDGTKINPQWFSAEYDMYF